MLALESASGSKAPVATATAVLPGHTLLPTKATFFLETVTLFLDEIPMPRRPAVPPAPSDREVFVDPLPGEDGSPELAEWLRAFGEAEEVWRLPNQERGYVLFCDSNSAAKCVAAHGGVWSESERALSGRLLGLTQKGQKLVRCAYPHNLVAHFNGKAQSRIKGIIMKTGAIHLQVFVGPTGAKGELGNSRVHFVFKGTPEQILDVKAELERRLAEVHESFADTMDETGPQAVHACGIPSSWSTGEVQAMFVAHGQVMSLHYQEGQGRAQVAFSSPGDARRAAATIDGLDVGDGALVRCDLKPSAVGSADGLPMLKDAASNEAPPKQERRASSRTSVFIANLPDEAEPESLRGIMKSVGKALSLSIVKDKESGKPRGFAFCDYPDAETAARAIQEISGTEYKGRQIRVDWKDAEKKTSAARSVDGPQNAKVFIGSLPPDVDTEQLHDRFAAAGEIIGLSLAIEKDNKSGHRGFGFCSYATAEAAQWAIQNLNNLEFQGRKLRVSLAKQAGGETRERDSKKMPDDAGGRSTEVLDEETGRSDIPASASTSAGVWERMIDRDSGSAYYVNHLSNESSWEPPPSGDVWEQLYDKEQGAYYYWNSVTKESRWHILDSPLDDGDAASGEAEEPRSRPRPTVRPSSAPYVQQRRSSADNSHNGSREEEHRPERRRGHEDRHRDREDNGWRAAQDRRGGSRRRRSSDERREADGRWRNWQQGDNSRRDEQSDYNHRHEPPWRDGHHNDSDSRKRRRHR